MLLNVHSLHIQTHQQPCSLLRLGTKYFRTENQLLPSKRNLIEILPSAEDLSSPQENRRSQVKVSSASSYLVSARNAIELCLDLLRSSRNHAMLQDRGDQCNRTVSVPDFGLSAQVCKHKRRT